MRNASFAITTDIFKDNMWLILAKLTGSTVFALALLVLLVDNDKGSDGLLLLRRSQTQRSGYKASYFGEVLRDTFHITSWFDEVLEITTLPRGMNKWQNFVTFD